LNGRIAFLPNDSKIDSEVCGSGNAHQLAPQLAKRSEINPRRADCHRGTNRRIEHPTGDRYDDAGRPLHLKELAHRPLFHATPLNLPAVIRVIPVMDFQLLPDMGRMNG
jgi:hypothetical protein